MDEAPWLNAEQRGLAALLLSSHQRAFKRPLITAARPGQSIRLRCQELFSSGFPVLAHGNGADPVLVYANAAALQLWGRPWADMVGMPCKWRNARRPSVATAVCASIALDGDS